MTTALDRAWTLARFAREDRIKAEATLDVLKRKEIELANEARVLADKVAGEMAAADLGVLLP